MKAQVELHQIDGYLPIGAAESRGPMSIGVVRSTDEATSHWIESIDSTVVNREFFDRVRRQWQQNVDWQPTGSLLQRQFVDEGERLIRVIDLPNGRALDELLVEGTSDLESALAITVSLTNCLRKWHEASRVHGGLAGDCVFLDLQNRVQLREATLFDGLYQQDFSALPTHAVMFYSPESSGSLPRSISPASDLYSVGALIFHLLAG